MTSVLFAALLFIVTGSWFLLPFLPALREHFGRGDIGPLRVNVQSADIRHFATSFRRLVEDQLPRLRGEAEVQPIITQMTDGKPVWYAPATRGTAIDAPVRDLMASRMLVVSVRPLVVPAGSELLRDIYVRASASADSNVVLRALASDGDITLSPRCVVLRWIDAAGSLTVAEWCTLWGRASCWGTMTIADGVRFQRLAASRIQFGGTARQSLRTHERQRRPVEVPAHAHVAAGRWMLDGDLVIPDGGIVTHDLVIGGTLTVGQGAELRGAIRATTVIADDECTFARSIIATERLEIGRSCRITGPVVIEGEGVFGDGTLIGAAGDETTITAVSVRMGQGVILCGEIWARRQGIVVVEKRGAPRAREA